MIYSCNYAHLKYEGSQKANTKSALEKGGIAAVFEWNFGKLGDDFKEKNKDILSIKKGAGLWVWKPYVILQSLKRVKDEDFLFYSDSGILILKDLKPLAEICAEKTQG